MNQRMSTTCTVLILNMKASIDLVRVATDNLLWLSAKHFIERDGEVWSIHLWDGFDPTDSEHEHFDAWQRILNFTEGMHKYSSSKYYWFTLSDDDISSVGNCHPHPIAIDECKSLEFAAISNPMADPRWRQILNTPPKYPTCTKCPIYLCS